MAKINLLPWREEKRKLREKNFFTALVFSIIFAASLVFAASIQIDTMISYQQSRNSYLTTEIKKVEKSIAEIKDLQKKKKSLLERMKVIQKFQTNRSDSVRLLDEIAKVLPEGVHLTEYKQNKKKQQFTGVAQSNARVSAFMRNIARSQWIEKPDLSVIKAKGKVEGDRYRYSIFSLTAVQKTTDSGDKKATGRK
ncbi:MAG: PilN domain-containing protein [Pseudomonadota bacterium]